MHLKGAPLECGSCSRKQSCCKNVTLFPVPVLPEEVEVFGEDNVEQFVDVSGEEHDLYVAKPGYRDDCPHYRRDLNSCGLGKKRPLFCKAYPVMYDGEKWYLDAGCPSAAGTTFRGALSDTSMEYRFLKRAVRIYQAVEDRFRAAIAQRIRGWRFPLVIDEIPEELDGD